MITLITAVPGSGKTLYTLKTVKEFSEKKDEDYPEGRKVYYYNIPLTEEGEQVLGWEKLETPEEWYKLPDGAIIIIDECQRVFPVRRAGSPVPSHVSEFETHRHHGFDVFLITQHGSLLDSNIRRLVGRHTHLCRIFGMTAAQVYNWEGYQQTVDSTTTRGQCADSYKFIYPKEVYGWYKSAVLHTHKRRLPRKIWLLVFVVLLAVVSTIDGIFAFKNLMSKSEAPPEQQQTSQTNQSSSALNPTSVSQDEKRTLTPVEYLALRRPRFRDQPESAPSFYDELNVAKTFPKLSACVQMGDECKCYTQQETKIFVPNAQCVEYVQNGWFDPYREESRDRQILTNREVIPQPQMISPPVETYRTGSRIATIGTRPEPEKEG